MKITPLNAKKNSVAAPANNLKPRPYIWREPSLIPPREWLYGRHYIRRYVTATIAASDVGKTSLAVAEILAMTAGKPLLGVPAFELLRVWYFNLEDPYDEIERRFAAAMLHYKLMTKDLGDRLFFNSGRDTPLIIGEEDRNGVHINQPTVDTLISEMIDARIDILIVDPFVSAHRVKENDNDAIDHIIKYGFGAVAERANIGVELIHHVRKGGSGAPEERTVDDARGATALISAVHSARVLNRMATKEAEQFGVPPDEARLTIRVDNGKSNMQRPPANAIWRRLVSVDLGNQTERRPSDLLQVAAAWSPPDPMSGIGLEQLAKIQKAIAAQECAQNPQANDWAGYVVAETLGLRCGSKQEKGKLSGLLAAWAKAIEHLLQDDALVTPVGAAEGDYERHAASLPWREVVTALATDADAVLPA